MNIPPSPFPISPPPTSPHPPSPSFSEVRMEEQLGYGVWSGRVERQREEKWLSFLILRVREERREAEGERERDRVGCVIV